MALAVDKDADIRAETATMEVVTTQIQMAQGALEKLSPDQLKRVIPFIAQHVTPDDQTRHNVANCLWILAGFSGYTAEVNHD